MSSAAARNEDEDGVKGRKKFPLLLKLSLRNCVASL